MYWCAASATSGNGMTVRWKSLMNHLCDKHEDCYHANDLGNRRKKWFIPGTKAWEKLSDIIGNPRLIYDIKKLSPSQQTSSVESYHSVINHFAPKLMAFCYHGMHCRLLIAAMHFNENYKRPQAFTRDGKERRRLTFPKSKQGECTPKVVPVPKTYNYANELMVKAIQLCLTNAEEDKGSHRKPPQLPKAPPHLASQYMHPDKDTIPEFSRYND
ncbi:uncharacterized protein [Dysidea avara]|uniref:uncharacterized protein n=1 Tax=Dysidea avara TaxID=196820 RepID=UPI0033334164